jgi:glycosyltransferase involved in cell wall biosynthesis
LVRHIAFAVPGDLATLTGGYGYDRRLIAELQALGWRVDVLSLGDGFPRPSAEQRAFALSRLLSLPQDVAVIVDGLALGALPEEAAKIASRAPLVALVHHPLALETGLSPADAGTLFESERTALASASAVIVTSPSTGERLSEDYDVPPDSIAVAPPGTDRGAPAKGRTDGLVRLLSVGAVVPRKGFDILISALAPITDLPWRLTIAGDLTRDQATVNKLMIDIAHHQLAKRIDLLGAVPHEQVTTLYSSSDIFVLASHFEGYGMAYAEAMAHGLPVIGTTGGATADTVPPNAGVLVDPGNVKALTRALKMLIEDKKARAWFASGALAASASLPTWQDTARIVSDALEEFA